MEREIKFRVWDFKRNQMILNGLQFIYQEEYGIHNIYDDRERSVEEYVIMQYTGLKDKNGKEIYEGDVHSKGNVVEFSFGSFNINGDTTLNAIASKIEIIGNIYQNQKLK